MTEVLVEIQDLGGEEMPEIGNETCPMKDLADFDSLSAVEAVTQLSERLSEELVPTLFWKKDGTPLKVEEIVERICQTINVEEGASRGWLDPKRMALAERLRVAREMAGLSQGQVAKKLGVHRPSVSEMEAGRRRISAEELAELANLYSVGLSWLVGGEDVPDEHQARAELAARELSKLREEDLDRVLKVLSALRKD